MKWREWRTRIGEIWNGERPPVSWPITTLALSAYLVAVLTHFPDLVITPRFWAEEGVVYFQSAYDRGFAAVWEPHVGYFALYPNVATWLATLVPLRNAPVVTLAFAIAGQLLPAFVVLRSRSLLLTNGVRTVLLAALVFNPSSVFELWLNTVNTQPFMQIAVFILLLEPRLRPWHLTLLGVCLLSAPIVAVVAAGFLVRALVCGGRVEWIAAALWGAGLATQLAMPHGGRPAGSVRVWAVSLLRENFGRAWLGDLGPQVLTWGGVAVAVFLVTLVAASRMPGLWVLAGIGLATATVAAALSLSGVGGARYSYGPFMILLTVVLIIVAGPLRGRLLGAAAVGLIVAALLIGVACFFDGGAWSSPDLCWADQVDAHQREVSIWPGPLWKVVLRG